MAKRKISFRITPLNIVFVLYLSMMAVVSLILLVPPFLLMALGKRKTADRMINRQAKAYSRHVFFMFGVKVRVNGLEHIPKTGNICFVSNHQGIADIPVIVGYIPRTVGFIAKKELGKVPVLNLWMRAMKCVLIDRSNTRNAVAAIQQAIENIRSGHPMVIFPEGTRSLGEQMGAFKPGSFKLVTGALCMVVPVTLNGTYKLVERTGKITPTPISITIHPAIDVAGLSNEERGKLSKRVEDIVKSGL